MANFDIPSIHFGNTQEGTLEGYVADARDKERKRRLEAIRQMIADQGQDEKNIFINSYGGSLSNVGEQIARINRIRAAKAAGPQGIIDIAMKGGTAVQPFNLRGSKTYGAKGMKAAEDAALAIERGGIPDRFTDEEQGGLPENYRTQSGMSIGDIRGIAQERAIRKALLGYI